MSKSDNRISVHIPMNTINTHPQALLDQGLTTPRIQQSLVNTPFYPCQYAESPVRIGSGGRVGRIANTPVPAFEALPVWAEAEIGRVCVVMACFNLCALASQYTSGGQSHPAQTLTGPVASPLFHFTAHPVCVCDN